MYRIKSAEAAWLCLKNAFDRDGPTEVSFDLEVGVDKWNVPINWLQCEKCPAYNFDTYRDVVNLTQATNCPSCGRKITTTNTIDLIIQGMTVVFRRPR